MGYFDNLFGYDWELSKKSSWSTSMETCKNGHAISMTPDAHAERTKKYANDVNYRSFYENGSKIWTNISKIFIKIQKNLQKHLQKLGLNLHIEIWVQENNYLGSRSSKRRFNLARSNSKKININ